MGRSWGEIREEALRRCGQLPPKTNYDRLRAMSVDEMAEWCFIITYNVACYYQGDEKLKYPVSPLGWLDWLKQEAEE